MNRKKLVEIEARCEAILDDGWAQSELLNTHEDLPQVLKADIPWLIAQLKEARLQADIVGGYEQDE